HVADVVDLDAVREAARAEAERTQAAAAELTAFTDDQDETDEPPDREAQAAAFAELSASASLEPTIPEPIAAPEPATAPEPTAAPEPTHHDEPFLTYGRAQDTDTASLLRELSSLGLDDEPAQLPARPARAVAAHQVQPAPKKKKGLFGRG
ncbi:MAG: hypothetical protein H7323_10715, partial [Frankiales bacterium]|nr:hypothetical protein [Frankiales bacterium]